MVLEAELEPGQELGIETGMVELVEADEPAVKDRRVEIGGEMVVGISGVEDGEAKDGEAKDGGSEDFNIKVRTTPRPA